MKRFYAVLVMTAVFTAAAVPPPPGIFNEPSREHLTWLESYSNATARGVDSPKVFTVHTTLLFQHWATTR